MHSHMMDYKVFDDEILLKLLKGGDGAALEEIYNRYSETVFVTAFRKVRSKEVAEELVQNLFISLWAKKEQARIEKLEAYLHAAIRYQVIDYIRSKILRERYTQFAKDQLTVDENASESKLLLQELSIAIDNTIKKLPQKTQEIFRLSRYEHRSVKEIAQYMNLSEKAVQYHVTQSLKFMRLHLRDFILMNSLVGAFTRFFLDN
ncbi:sigma-70 family RNA polymerase sigma factor [Pseudoflavitalea sp. X16]|uniref:RNA polymerase sigma factor n=1 Tax=Paraflavitalea devenefica TaxID=2716334 RepID=UPI00141FA844|nr:sigma-70 family RNA polymerase sigma factor [Paraflavitalea devenefica]NII23539.1 sigma-70 family RNA polymerase sigma factor [Paraflavitalea devenefica]